MHKDVNILVMVLAMSIATGATSASSVDEIVTTFYPPRLVAEDEQFVSDGANPGNHTQVWAPLTAAGDVIAVAYSNANSGDVRVLKIGEGRGTLVWELGELLDGDNPKIQTADLNGDGHLDFAVTFKTGQGLKNVSSLFLFDGRSVTPVSLGANYNPSFVDLDGDGVMELSDGCLDNDGNPWGAFYRLTPAGYKQAEPVPYHGTNGRGDRGEPGPQTDHFVSKASSATLLVLNGVRGFPRSAAVEVYLNGERVISRNQLNETVERVQVPVTLLTNDEPNTITSTVFGKLNAAVDLFVYVAGAEANTNASK